MKKALFVHGLGSNANSSTGKAVKEILKYFDIDVITDTFDLTNPKATISKIKSYVRNIDILIGTSLGGFYVLNETNSLPKIVINPCMFPSIEIPKLTSVSSSVIEEWEFLEEKCYSSIDAEMRACVYGIFGLNDELFSYLKEFKKLYGRKGNYTSGSGSHHMSSSNLENYLPLAMDYFDNLGKPIKEKRLDEHYVNMFSKRSEDKELFDKYGVEVYEMLEKAYAPIGGLAGCDSYKDLVNDSDMWKLEIKKGEILSVFIYSFKRGGRKLQYLTHNGTSEGKASFLRIMKDDKKFLDRMFWAEVSGAVEHYYIDKVRLTPIPSIMAQEILADKTFKSFNPDGFHYTREIGGELHEKIMVGSEENINNIIKQNK